MTTVAQVVATMLGLGSLLPLIALAIFLRRRTLLAAIAVPVIAATSIVGSQFVVLLSGIDCGGGPCADGRIILPAVTSEAVVHTCVVILAAIWATISLVCLIIARHLRAKAK